jgi:hypothetical protein
MLAAMRFCAASQSSGARVTRDRCFVILLVGGLLAACETGGSSSKDGGSTTDASVSSDAGPGECGPPPPFDLPREHVPPPSEAEPIVVMLRARRVATSIVVLAWHPYSKLSAVNPGGMHSLLVFDADGILERTLTVHRTTPLGEMGAPTRFAADFVASEAGIDIVGSEWSPERSSTSLWHVRVSTSWEMVESVVDEVRDELDVEFVSPQLFATPEGLLLLFLRDGALMLRRGIDGEERALDLRLATHTILATSAEAIDDTFCVAALEQEQRALHLVRLEGEVVRQMTPLVARGSPFAPVPVSTSGDCRLTYFQPNDLHPTRGVLGEREGALITGWRGLAPLGVASVGDRAAFVVPGPRAPPDVDLFIVEPTLSLCAVTTPAARGVSDVLEGHFGSVLAVGPGLTGDFVLGNFTAPGAVTLARVQ